MSRKAKGLGFTQRSGKSPAFKMIGSSPVKFDWDAYFAGTAQPVEANRGKRFKTDREEMWDNEYKRRRKKFGADPEHSRYRAEKLGGSHLAAWETQQRNKFGKDWVKPEFEGVKSFEEKIKRGKYTRGTPYEKYHMKALGITDWSQLDE